MNERNSFHSKDRQQFQEVFFSFEVMEQSLDWIEPDSKSINPHPTLVREISFFFIKELVRGPVKDTEDDDTKTKTKKKKRKKERKKRKRNINRGSRVKRP